MKYSIFFNVLIMKDDLSKIKSNAVDAFHQLYINTILAEGFYC